MNNVLLVGTPNCGKTSVYNLITGKFQKVSNYAGVTVDVGVAEFLSNGHHDQKLNLIDLPGITTLIPQSLDEGITIHSLLGQNKKFTDFNLIIVVLDFHRLEATMSLLFELKELFGKNKIVGLINKVDSSDYITIENQKKLEDLIQSPLLFCSALKDRAERIDHFIREHCTNSIITPISKFSINKESMEFLPFINKDEIKLNYLTQQDHFKRVQFHQKLSRVIFNKIFTMADRFKEKQTYKIDKVLLHPIIGSIIFFAIFYIMFLAVYAWSGPVMDGVEFLFSQISSLIINNLNPSLFRDFLTDGLVSGVGSVIIFLPQILILFFLLSILEQSGYIARAAFLSDKVLSVFGLNGKAFLPYLSGFACAVPAIMTTRTIPNKKERLATLLTIPLTTCSARLPVYLLLIGTFVPEKIYFGIFNSRALSFFFLYFLGSIFTLLIAKFFRLTLFAGKSTSFFIDLPYYQSPSLKIAIRSMIQKGRIFLKKAGTIILTVTIIVWFASNFPKPNQHQLSNINPSEVSKINLEYSVIGRIGKIIEPAIEPIGMDWKIGIALISAFAAREIFVSTLATIFSVEETATNQSLSKTLLNEKNLKTNKPLFTLATAWSVLIFFVFSLQCTSTVAVIFKETGSAALTSMIFVAYLVIAYAASFFTYNLLL